MQAYHYTSVAAQRMEGVPGVTLRWVIGDNVEAPNFQTRVIELQPGAATEHHQHAWEHEVFVLEGQGLVLSASGDAAIGPGDCVYIPPEELHQFRNAGDGVLRFICIIPKLPKSA